MLLQYIKTFNVIINKYKQIINDQYFYIIIIYKWVFYQEKIKQKIHKLQIITYNLNATICSKPMFIPIFYFIFILKI